MDYADKKILENQLAVPIGRAVNKWMKEHQVDEPVVVNAVVSTPSCYIDETGVSHTGRLITVNCEIVLDDDDDDDFDD